jgi:hypothetical protein
MIDFYSRSIWHFYIWLELYSCSSSFNALLEFLPFCYAKSSFLMLLVVFQHDFVLKSESWKTEVSYYSLPTPLVPVSNLYKANNKKIWYSFILLVIYTRFKFHYLNSIYIKFLGLK